MRDYDTDALCEVAIAEHRHGGVALFEIEEEFVTMTVSDMTALAVWLTAEEKDRGELRGVPALLFRLSVLTRNAIQMYDQLQTVAAGITQQEEAMTNPETTDGTVVHQGTVLVSIDFRATLPSDVFLGSGKEGETLEEALGVFADDAMIRAAITNSPKSENVSVENVTFGLAQIASFEAL
jgi:hypothetical protein